jgi:rhodanese-related sulfurtransferase
MTAQLTLPPVVDVETTATLLAEQAPITIIDVRTPAEFESAHIPGSYNVPLDLLPEHRAELRDALRAPAILVCRSGQRARQAE